MATVTEIAPDVLRILHGSTFRGDGERALLDEIAVLREVFGRQMAGA